MTRERGVNVARTMTPHAAELRVAMLLAPAAVASWGAPKAPDPAAKPSIWELPGRLGEVQAFEPSRWPPCRAPALLVALYLVCKICS